MTVVIIIGVLAAIAIPNFNRLVDRAKEASVKSNCHTLQLSAENFAILNGGTYAANIDVDTTPGGGTILSMLPSGAMLQNPFTRAATEPVNGAAATAGQTGYVPIVNGGVNEGYTITGFGETAVLITLSSGS